MRIRNNLMADNTNRKLEVSRGKQAKAAEKLSSGYRINYAADDAAGLAISEKMRAIFREKGRCMKNVEEGVNATHIADGALENLHALTTRARELAIQAGNDTNSLIERQSIELEINAIFEEIDDITYKTNYNGIPLLRNSVGVTPLPLIARIVDESLKANITNFEYGALWLVESPQQNFVDLHAATPAKLTMQIDPSIDFNDPTTLEGKSVTVNNRTFTFANNASTPTQGLTQDRIAYNTVQNAFDNLVTYANYYVNVGWASATLDSATHSVTFTSQLQSSVELLQNVRINEIIAPIYPNPYQSGDPYNGTRVSNGSSVFIKPVAAGSTNPSSANLLTVYDTTARLSVPSLNSSDILNSSGLTAAQVSNLTDSGTATPHHLEFNLLGTQKTITFSTSGSTGLTGNNYNIAIQEGMTGAQLQTALKTAFAALGADADFGPSGTQLTLTTTGSLASTWNVISLKEVLAADSGSPTDSISSTSRTATTYFATQQMPILSQYEPGEGEIGSTYIVTLPDLATLKAMVGNEKTVSIGNYVFWDSTATYTAPNPTLTNNPPLPNTSTSTWITESVTSGPTLSPSSNYIDINGLTDTQLKEIAAANLLSRYNNQNSYAVDEGNGTVKIYYYTSSTTAPYLDSSGRLTYTFGVTRQTHRWVDGTTIKTGQQDLLMPDATTQYFTRAAQTQDIQLQMNGSNVDLAALDGTGFQLKIQANPEASDSYTNELRFQFRTDDTPDYFDSITGNYIINVKGLTNPADVAAKARAVISSITGADTNTNAELSVSINNTGIMTISSRYRTSPPNLQPFNGLFADGFSTGLFPIGAEGVLSGGTTESRPGTVIDFSSINNSNVKDLLGKGFRIACATCENEYFNVLFVDKKETVNGIEDISIYSSGTYYNYFVELNLENMSKTFDGASIVRDIYEQLQLSGTLNHFTEVEIGVPASTLIISDKRYDPKHISTGQPAMGYVIPGVYLGEYYSAKVTNIYADPPEKPEIPYSTLDIYVGSQPQHTWIPIHIPNLSLATLRLKPPEVMIRNHEDAVALLDRIDKAAKALSSVRAQFGADMNTLETCFAGLAIEEENIAAAESRIRDAEMAKEMAEFTKDRITTESSTAMLAQANALPETVLKILSA